ncbi:low affinity immunoglobulin epsilon Fc receptor-like [Palaemon carinicauda]|uniref:low affinity immunoglobulin epsilon Fc receptor-like n=1 Tax=Palaemon carinicauda TaxID=392227 RepID=UPI0035B5DF3D
MFEDSCYYVYCGYQKRSWHQARGECTGLGGELVKITSEAENDFVADQISSYSHWIGLNDVDYEGTFKWSVDNSDLGSGYSRWGSGTPSSYLDCVKMNDGEWYGDHCYEDKCYICEREPS